MIWFVSTFWLWSLHLLSQRFFYYDMGLWTFVSLYRLGSKLFFVSLHLCVQLLFWLLMVKSLLISSDCEFLFSVVLYICLWVLCWIDDFIWLVNVILFSFLYLIVSALLFWSLRSIAEFHFVLISTCGWCNLRCFEPNQLGLQNTPIAPLQRSKTPTPAKQMPLLSS